MLTSVNLLRDRRVIPIAIANCYAIDASPDNSTSGKFEFVVPEYIFVFLNAPMGKPGSPSVISAEVLGPLDVAAKKFLLKDIVQIYRRGQ